MENLIKFLKPTINKMFSYGDLWFNETKNFVFTNLWIINRSFLNDKEIEIVKKKTKNFKSEFNEEHLENFFRLIKENWQEDKIESDVVYLNYDQALIKTEKNYFFDAYEVAFVGKILQRFSKNNLFNTKTALIHNGEPPFLVFADENNVLAVLCGLKKI